MPSTRRNFIKKTGYISIGFSLMGATSLGNDMLSTVWNGEKKKGRPDQAQINAWLQLLENGEVLILSGKVELGQGLRTALKQIAAEELDMALDRIQVQLAETGKTPNEGYTAGSRSIETSGMTIRNAAASAREIVLKMASEKWGMPVSQLQLKDGMIIGADTRLSLNELLEGRQIEQAVSEPTGYRAKTVRKFVGKPIPRTDIDDMVRGNPVFVQDLRFPDMVHARVIRPTGYASRLSAFDASKIERRPGFLKLVRKGSFLGVIAEEEYQVIQLKEAGEEIAQWESQEKLPENSSLKTYIKTLPAETENHEQKGDVASVFENAAIGHSASYFKPYVMHAAMGPSCGIALFEEGKLSVWTNSQGIYPLRKSLAELLAMAEDDIHITGVPGAGCYGHNGSDDAAVEAALMAIAYPGKHVRNQWMRQDEHGWEPYGTAMAIELKAAVDTDGTIRGWQQEIWSDGHSNRPGGSPDTLLPARFLDQGYGAPGIGYRGGAVRNSVPYYPIENLSVQSHIFRGPLRTSSLRGLGAYTNIFAIESFMDELADKAGRDPFEFRLKHLTDERAKFCLQKLGDTVADIRPKKGDGLGFGFTRYKNSGTYCAVAALVSVNRESGRVRTQKMWAVIDAGETINPDGLRNQTEGGMVQSASWALKEEVRFDAQHVTSLDWESYPIFRFPETPATEVEVIDRVDQPPTGAGEAVQGPATAAVVNAIFDATGVRIRELPVDTNLLKSGTSG